MATSANTDSLFEELRARVVKLEADAQAQALKSFQSDALAADLRIKIVQLDGDVQTLKESLRQRPVEVEALNQNLIEDLSAEVNGTISLWKQELHDNSKVELHRAESHVNDLKARLHRLEG